MIFSLSLSLSLFLSLSLSLSLFLSPPLEIERRASLYTICAPVAAQ